MEGEDDCQSTIQQFIKLALHLKNCKMETLTANAANTVNTSNTANEMNLMMI